jgi:hypothetical protein
MHLSDLHRMSRLLPSARIACLGIATYLSCVDDAMVRHEHLSRRDEELMHFMEEKYTIDTYCGRPEDQKAVEDTLDSLLHRMRVNR